MKISKRIFITITTAFVFLLTINISNAQLLNTVVALTGNVFDAVTKKPVTLVLIAQNSKGKMVSATRSNAYENGYYYLTGLKPGEKYVIILRKKNYFIDKFNITIANTDRYEELSHDFLINPMYIGAKIPLPVPPFEINKFKLRYGAGIFLTNITNTLRDNPNVKVAIQCYPDNNKNKQKNIELTFKRCQSLKVYFSQNGIDTTRISVKPNKSTDPNNPPPTQERSKGNRYVGTSYLVVEQIK